MLRLFQPVKVTVKTQGNKLVNQAIISILSSPQVLSLSFSLLWFSYFFVLVQMCDLYMHWNLLDSRSCPFFNARTEPRTLNVLRSIWIAIFISVSHDPLVFPLALFDSCCPSSTLCFLFFSSAAIPNPHPFVPPFFFSTSAFLPGVIYCQSFVAPSLAFNGQGLSAEIFAIAPPKLRLQWISPFEKYGEKLWLKKR